MDIEAELKPAPVISKSQKMWKIIKEKTAKVKLFVLKALRNAEVQRGIIVTIIFGLTIGTLVVLFHYSLPAFFITLTVILGMMGCFR